MKWSGVTSGVTDHRMDAMNYTNYRSGHHTTINPCSEILLGETIFTISESNAMSNTNYRSGHNTTINPCSEILLGETISTISESNAMTKVKKFSPEGKQYMNDTGREICEKVAAVRPEMIFEVEGTPMLIVKKESGEFRNQAIVSHTQFFLTEAYIGERDGLIFSFEPVDTQNYKTLEIPSTKIDSIFPLMGGEVGKLFGLPETKERMVDVINIIISNNVKEKRKMETEEIKEKEKISQNNPLWGRF